MLLWWGWHLHLLPVLFQLLLRLLLSALCLLLLLPSAAFCLLP
jgi:hypothetical protein